MIPITFMLRFKLALIVTAMALTPVVLAVAAVATAAVTVLGFF